MKFNGNKRKSLDTGKSQPRLPAFYNVDGAGAFLDDYILERSKVNESAADIIQLINVAKHFDRFEPVKYDDWDRWCLVWKDTNTEVVFRAQGVVIENKLPPVMPDYYVKPEFASQSVTIVGCGSSKFTTTFDCVSELYQRFTRALAKGDLLPREVRQLSDMDTLHASNRYFLPKDKITEGDICNIPVSIDPSGRLRAIRENSGYVHTIYNRVDYKIATEGSSFEHCSPSRFREGDIVELEFCFVLMPKITIVNKTKRVGYGLRQSLVGVSLISDKFAIAAGVACDARAFSGPSTLVSLPKRRREISFMETEGSGVINE